MQREWRRRKGGLKVEWKENRGGTMIGKMEGEEKGNVRKKIE